MQLDNVASEVHDLPLENQGIKNTLSLFSGIGGLDLGAEVAGFSIAGGVDMDSDALSSMSQALCCKTMHGQIQDIDPYTVIRSFSLENTRTMYLIGGPPCTAFSHAGFWLNYKRDSIDPQVGRLNDYLKYVLLFKPRAFVLENVPGLAFKNHRHNLEMFVEACERAGYSVSQSILNAANFGVAQTRKRLFVVGVLGNHEFHFPQGVFSKDRWRTAGWAFADLKTENNPSEHDELLTGKHAHLLNDIPPGKNYSFYTEECKYPEPLFKWRSRYSSFLSKLHPDQPASTILAQRIGSLGPFHWDNRRLRIREITRLQSFPDEYPLSKRSLARKHVGNAVPPLLAAWLFWHLRIFLGEVHSNELPECLGISKQTDTTYAQISSLFGEHLTKVTA